MNKYCLEYQKDIENQITDPKGLIEQGILLYNILYSRIKKYRDTYENQWLFVKNEDLSKNPMIEFRKIYSFLDLDFTHDIVNKISQTSTSSRISKFNRNSLENITSWKRILSKNEINMIKEETYAVWQHFYEEREW